LIGFVAHLERKLWLENKKLGIFSSTTKGNLGHFS